MEQYNLFSPMMASPLYHETIGGYIIIPRQYFQPQNFTNSWYNAHSYENQPRDSFDHVPLSLQESRLERMMYQLIEGQQKYGQDIDAKFERFSSSFGEKFESLSTQIHGIEARVKRIEEIQQQHFRYHQKNKTDTINVKYALDDMYKHIDWKINDAKENVTELITNLNTTPIKAIQAEKTTKETVVIHAEKLLEGQKQSTQAINDVQLAGKFKDITGKTITRNGKSLDLISRCVKTIDDRLVSLEDMVDFCISLYSMDEEPVTTENLFSLTTYAGGNNDLNPPKDVDIVAPTKSEQNSKSTQGLTARISFKRPHEGIQLAERIHKGTTQIGDEMLEEFNSMVRSLPSDIEFEEAWRKYPLEQPFDEDEDHVHERPRSRVKGNHSCP